MLTQLLATVALAACAADEKAVITRYPGWDYTKYQRVMVGRFSPAADPRSHAAARLITEKLVDLLTNNGTFTVVSRSEFKDIMTEQDLSQLAEVADPSTVISPGKVKAAQAIIVGRLTEFDITRQKVDRRIPILFRDRRGRVVRDSQGRTKTQREDTVTSTRTEIRIAGSFRLINTATSEVVFSFTSPPIVKESVAGPGEPPADPDGLVAAAATSLANEFFVRLAPVKMQIELDEDMLIVATGYFDGEYDEASRISTDIEKFLVVVRGMPRDCDRNPFRIAISPKDKPENILERELIWEAESGAAGVTVEIPVAELKPHATGRKTEFVLKLYSGKDPAPLLDRDFKLEVRSP